MLLCCPSIPVYPMIRLEPGITSSCSPLSWQKKYRKMSTRESPQHSPRSKILVELRPARTSPQGFSILSLSFSLISSNLILSSIVNGMPLLNLALTSFPLDFVTTGFIPPTTSKRSVVSCGPTLPKVAVPKVSEGGANFQNLRPHEE